MPVLLAERLKLPAHHHAGVVHQHSDRPMVAFGRAHECLHLVGPAGASQRTAFAVPPARRISRTTPESSN